MVWGRERCDGLPEGVGEALAKVLVDVMLSQRRAVGALG